MDAYEYLGQIRFNVQVEDKTFCINELLLYSTTLLENTKVKGIVLKSPLDYKTKRYEFLKGYTIAGYTDGRGSLKTAKVMVNIDGHIFDHKRTTVVIGENFRGNVKEYLKQKYGMSVLFLKETGYERLLDHDINVHGRFDNESYTAILGLTGMSGP